MEALSIERIQGLKQQGLSNNQIIQNLQKEGYHSSQIFDALNQVSIQPKGFSGATMPPNISRSPQGLNRPLPGIASMAAPGDEELIETIIDEKWNDLLEDINRIIAWKDRTTQRVDQFDQQLKDLKEQFDRLHQAVIGKVGEYDKHIMQVGAEVKAMEKVFSKVLPTFTENVNELSRVAQTMRSVPKKSEKK